AARMQGQIDGLRESLIVPDEHILHLNSKNTYEESHKVISAILPTITSAQHIVILGINDEVTMGALAAFTDAGASERVIAIGQGADQTARQELQRPGSRMIGSVTSFPEHYGELIIATTLQVLQGKQVPPAVYTHHMLVLSEETKQKLDLSKLAEEMISIREYDTIPFSRAERNPSYRRLKTR
ncbi:MAG TPA: substrate-binding domain-containing protein, partial [Ktedonobacteraceae bacterium]